MKLMITIEEALRNFEAQEDVDMFAADLAHAFIHRAGNPQRFTAELMACLFDCVFEAGRTQGRRECST